MSDDCISRQAVLDEMMLIPIAPLMVGDGVVYKKGVLEGTIKALPSVTQEPKTGFIPKSVIEDIKAEIKEEADVSMGSIGDGYYNALDIIDKHLADKRGDADGTNNN